MFKFTKNQWRLFMIAVAKEMNEMSAINSPFAKEELEEWRVIWKTLIDAYRKEYGGDE